jgi:hypothetical protein
MTAKQKANQARFKKVVAEASKLRKKDPKLTQAQAVKKAWAMFTGKKVGLTHKDTKSHNVNIRVVSGWKKGSTAFIEKDEEKTKSKKNYRVSRAGKNNLFEKPGTFRKFNLLAGLFDTTIIKDIDALKKEYFKLAKKYHPDAGGTDKQFQDLQNEYEKLFKSLLSGSTLSADDKKTETEIDVAIRKIIDEIIILPNINIELIGKWLWVGGNTYPVHKELKKAGLVFIKKEGVPFWVYKGVQSSSRGGTSLDEIKKKYGSQTIPSTYKKAISGTYKINKVKLVANLKKIVKALNKRLV